MPFSFVHNHKAWYTVQYTLNVCYHIIILFIGDLLSFIIIYIAAYKQDFYLLKPAESC
jgi:hypothetical protein